MPCFVYLELFRIFTKGNGTHQASSAGPKGFHRQQRLWKVYSGVCWFGACLILVVSIYVIFVFKPKPLFFFFFWASKAVPKRKQWSATQTRGPKRVKAEVKSTQTDESGCLVNGMSIEAYDLMVKGRIHMHSPVKCTLKSSL